MDYKIFEAGLYDYSDDPRVNVTKPVLYTPKFFEDMLKNVTEVPLDTKHDNVVIGSLSNLSFKDNFLQGNINTDKSLTGKGVSPVFRYDTIDRGDYVEAVNGELTSAGLTDTPRSNIIFNSYTTKIEEGEKMVSEEAFEQLSKQNRKLERELATKENLLQANNSKLEELSSLREELKSLKAENTKFTSELERIRPLAEKYTAYESEKKEALLDEIAKDDNGLREKLSEWDISQLELMKSQRTVTTEPQGVPSQVIDAPPVTPPVKDPNEYTMDTFKENFKAVTGEEPKYI